MKAVVKETMRLHPPAPFIPRESMQGQMHTGWLRNTIENSGSHKQLSLWKRSGDMGKSPFDYNQERIEDDINIIDVKDQDFRLVPFGGGRRGCPGTYFGLARGDIASARLSYHLIGHCHKELGLRM
ncbi:hypothetical protein FEM48_Zijuj10G0043600 [Ziziphus jujuba var. spinosa]|uniref:Uncharacterized protein n=1 Tax=Ziziphus jujuba var. spinosa TaxID=714518 RepID=A0A978UL97_ZIZJJ|nr:hypothetical protein FEM48_Zijuj10G0043600 [Ziziphus jujuba var. spinosa]